MFPILRTVANELTPGVGLGVIIVVGLIALWIWWDNKNSDNPCW